MNPTEPTWSVSWQDTPLVTTAKYGLGNEMWMAGSAMTRFDQRSTARAYWSTAVGDRETLRAVVLGVGEAANCEVRFDVCRCGDAFDLTLRAGCAHDRAGHPLVLQPGKRFRTCRYFLLACDHVNEGLEDSGRRDWSVVLDRKAVIR